MTAPFRCPPDWKTWSYILLCVRKLHRCCLRRLLAVLPEGEAPSEGDNGGDPRGELGHRDIRTGYDVDRRFFLLSLHQRRARSEANKPVDLQGLMAVPNGLVYGLLPQISCS